MKFESLLVYPKQAQELLGIGPTKFHELTKQPGFPKSKIPNGKRRMFLRSELEEWAKSI